MMLQNLRNFQTFKEKKLTPILQIAIIELYHKPDVFFFLFHYFFIVRSMLVKS